MPEQTQIAPCRCQSDGHGHAAGQCHAAATESNDHCRPCDEETAREAFDAFTPMPVVVRWAVRGA